MKADKVIQMLNSKCHHKGRICELLIEIITLQEKLNNPAQQSFYFKRGIEQQRKRFVILKDEYESLRNHINNNTLRDLQASLESQKKRFKKQKSKIQNNLIDRMYTYSLYSGVVFRENMIEAKNKYNRLFAWEYYLENPDALEVFFDV